MYLRQTYVLSAGHVKKKTPQYTLEGLPLTPASAGHKLSSQQGRGVKRNVLIKQKSAQKGVLNTNFNLETHIFGRT